MKLQLRHRKLGWKRFRLEPLESRWLMAITVNTLVDEQDGSLIDGDISLRDALAMAASDDIIDFEAGLNAGTILLKLGELPIKTALTMDASTLSSGLIIDASGNDPTPNAKQGDGSRVFHISDGNDATSLNVSIHGLTLIGGDAQGNGGAILSSENLTIRSCRILRNAARANDSGQGGGIYGTSVTVISSTISDNSANSLLLSSGGGISADRVDVTSSEISKNTALAYAGQPEGSGGGIAAREVTVTSSTISGNSAGKYGGGISADTVTVTSSGVMNNLVYAISSRGGGIDANSVMVFSSTISGNAASGDLRPIGGGISGRTVTVDSSTISGNNAGLGGGISGGTVTVISSTISGNNALILGSRITTHGGGIYGSDVTVISSTVSRNTASGADMGQSFEGYGGISSRRVKLNRSIVAGNSRDLGSDGNFVLSSTFSLIGDNLNTGLSEAPLGMPDANGNLIGGPINGVINPRLGSLADNGGPTQTHALRPGSPAIDAGDPAAMVGVGDVPVFDQRGLPYARIAGGRIDMGAFELQTPGDMDSDGDVDSADIDRLCEAVRHGGPLSPFDLDGSGSIDLADTEVLVKNILRTSFGDANVDGMFNSSDLRKVFQAGEYEDEVAGNSTWSQGDWNCDGDFTTSDLVAAFRDGAYEQAAAVSASPSDVGAAITTGSSTRESLSVSTRQSEPGKTFAADNLIVSGQRPFSASRVDSVFDSGAREKHELVTTIDRNLTGDEFWNEV